MEDRSIREIRSLFLSNGRCCRFSAGEQIWVKDSEAGVLYYLERGKVRAYYIYPDGTDRTLCFVGRGNLVGEEVMAHPPLRIDYVDAVTDVLLYSLDHDTLMALLLQSPAALDGLMALFMKKIELLCSWIFYAQFRQNSEKLACFLYYSTKDGPRVDYTQQQIADVTGMTRVSVSNGLRQLAEQGVIALAYKKIRVLDRQALRERFGGLEFVGQ
ncbi:MAG: Crp/Fnr family transcriptional regulator [Oscillibacter sp.]|nr:Crp/Fnr family transcriptional regulator [Oscillibacter sp.]